MEWDAPAIILDVRPYGEGDAVATVMTQEHGLHRGLARGGASRGKVATWQPGNMVQVQWTARLSDQLGSFTGEMIHAGASYAMQEAMPLAMLTAVCAVAEGALPEREPLPRVFDGLLHLIPRLPLGDSLLTEVVRWELTVLSDLGLQPEQLLQHLSGLRLIVTQCIQSGQIQIRLVKARSNADARLELILRPPVILPMDEEDAKVVKRLRIIRTQFHRSLQLL